MLERQTSSAISKWWNYPNGDWAFSLMRQYLFDSLESIRLNVLAESKWEPLADTAAKIRPEELYHLRHTRTWVRRLGLGTEESNKRMQNRAG